MAIRDGERLARAAHAGHLGGHVDDHVLLAADHAAATELHQDLPGVHAVFRAGSTARLSGTFTLNTFSTSVNSSNPDSVDGIFLQVGGVAPG